MEVVVVRNGVKVIFQVVYRRDDAWHSHNSSGSGYPDELLFESENHQFKYRPTQATLEFELKIGAKTVNFITDGVSQDAIEALLMNENIVAILEKKQWCTVVDKYSSA